MPTADAIAQQMRSALALSEPDLDTSIGSPTRKILDAVAVAIAPAYADASLADYTYDIYAKTGTDLDAYVAQYGFARYAASRAVGSVTFSRKTPADQDYPIPAGTQIVSGAITSDPSTPVIATSVPVVLATGQTSVSAPVVAQTGGTAGNVPANTLTLLTTALAGITAVTNPNPLYGGVPQESDAALITRFTQTVFRSLAGTMQMYLGTALEPYAPGDQPGIPQQNIVTAAAVIGASRRHREQIQIDGTGSGTSSMPAANLKYVYDGTQVVGANIDQGDILIPGVDYSFDTTVSPPVVTIMNNSAAAGDLLDLDYEYLPVSSRNDPSKGITNRVDVWVTGEDPVLASQVAYFPTSASQFSSAAGSPLLASNFTRQDTNDVSPTPGNYFVPLAFGPILDFPTELVIGGVGYVLGVDYWVVHDESAFGRGPTSLFGLEWLASRALPNGTQMALTGDYGWIYNYAPWHVESAIRDWDLETVDSRAHAAKKIQLYVNLAVMFDPAATNSDAVKVALATALSAFFATQGVGAVVQMSDILQVAHRVLGVDNVRLITQGENAVNYAVQRVGSDLSVISTYAVNGRATDFVLRDTEVPVLAGVNVAVKAQNTWDEGS